MFVNEQAFLSNQIDIGIDNRKLNIFFFLVEFPLIYVLYSHAHCTA
jgi:hypothetical protein